MSRLFVCLMMVAALASFAQIAPPRHRHRHRHRHASSNSGYNLVVEISERALNAGIRQIRPWLAAQLHHTDHLLDFEKHMHIVKMKVYNTQLNRVDLGDLEIKLGNNGSADLVFPNVHLTCESEWNSTAHMTHDRGTLTTKVDEATLDLRHLVPIAFAGMPFIDPDVDCHAAVESLTLRFSGSRSINLYNIIRPLIERFYRTEIEKMLCYEAVDVLDRFLREGIERLSLHHLIYGKHILNYALVADPQFVGTSLVLKHSGHIDEQAAQPHFKDHQAPDGDWMVKYSIHQNLINQMLAIMADTSAFDSNITVSNTEHYTKIQLSLIVVQPPTVAIGDQMMTLNIVSRWSVYNDENDEISLSTVYSEDFDLETTFDSNAQLQFKLNATQTDEQQSNDEENNGATESRSLFLSAVRQHYSTIISQSLLLPLPKFANTTAIAGHVGFADGFILFGANFAPADGTFII